MSRTGGPTKSGRRLGIGLAAMLLVALGLAGTRGEASSAAVGVSIANSSHGTTAAVNSFLLDLTDPAAGSVNVNVRNAVALMVTDVNGDGSQDIKVVVTTPPLGNFSIRQGILLVDGASGNATVNSVTLVPSSLPAP